MNLFTEGIFLYNKQESILKAFERGEGEMKALLKIVSIGIGVGLAVYAAGMARDCKEKQEIAREREKFGTGA